MTEFHVVAALAKRFGPPTYAFMPQVRNGVGFARKKDRTADAIAMGLWPSRGLDIHGFEVKVSRADWVRELRDPEKSADIQRFCDRWWIAVSDAEIVAPGELPDTWGLLAIGKRGNAEVVREAPRLKSEPLDRLMMASLFRKFHEVNEAKAAKSVPKEEFDARLKLELAEAERNRVGYRELELMRMKRAIERFEHASGVKLNEWNGERVGNAVKVVEEIGVDVLRQILCNVQHEAERLSVLARNAIAKYDEHRLGDR